MITRGKLEHFKNVQKSEHIAQLITAHLYNRLTSTQLIELADWVTVSDDNRALFERLSTGAHLLKEWDSKQEGAPSFTNVSR